jgi:hypothetical protein
MSVVDTLLGKLRKKHAERERSSFEPYRELLIELANDRDHIDVDELEIILERAGKTQEQLTKDVSTMRQRLAWSAEYGELQRLRQQVDKATQEQSRIEAELKAANDRLRPMIDEARQRRLEFERLVASSDYAGRRLWETVLHPEILEREAELTEERKRLHGELREWQERLHEAQKPARLSELALEAAEQKLGKCHAGDKVTQAEGKRAISEHQYRLGGYRDQIERLQEKILPIRQRLDEIDVELADLNPRKMIP